MFHIVWGFLFLFAGFMLESCVCVYHRSREHNRILLSSIFGAIITCIGVLVTSRIVFNVLNSPLGHLSLRLYPKEILPDSSGRPNL